MYVHSFNFNEAIASKKSLSLRIIIFNFYYLYISYNKQTNVFESREGLDVISVIKVYHHDIE